jgi:hypothetical protein
MVDAAVTPRARPRLASDVCRTMHLDDAARALLDPTMTPREYIDALLANELYIAAIEVIAPALPLRLGLWWGLLCLQHATADEEFSLADRTLCRLLIGWLHKPSDATRAAVEGPARETGVESMTGLLGYAVAAGGTGDAAIAVANAVKLACARASPMKVMAVQRAYAVLGLNLELPTGGLSTDQPPIGNAGR